MFDAKCNILSRINYGLIQKVDIFRTLSLSSRNMYNFPSILIFYIFNKMLWFSSCGPCIVLVSLFLGDCFLTLCCHCNKIFRFCCSVVKRYKNKKKSKS